MTIASVINDVCLAVGVAAPTGSVFPTSPTERTKAEMISLANEMAARIAFDTRDWTALRHFGFLTSTAMAAGPSGMAAQYMELALPSDFRRMLKSSNVYKGGNYGTPMRFIGEPDEWIRTTNQVGTNGDWMLDGREKILIRPIDAFGTTYEFPYLCNSCTEAVDGSYANAFTVDTDTFIIDERLLTLGMIWLWRARKGGAYQEAMQDYEDALASVSGADKPAPILVGGAPVSHATSIAFPYQLGPPS